MQSFPDLNTWKFHHFLVQYDIFSKFIIKVGVYTGKTDLPVGEEKYRTSDDTRVK